MAIYFPVLRWKLGERAALANLTPPVKDQISPIIEFPLGCDYNDSKVTNFCSTLLSDWGDNRPFYLDLSTIDFEGASLGDVHPALTLIRDAHEQNLLLIPVLNLGMDQGLFTAVRQAFQEGCFSNAALRVTDDEEDSAGDDALDMIRDLGLQKANIDLIIDLGCVSDGPIRPKIRILSMLVAEFGPGYRNVILLSGAIPSDLSNHVDTDTSERIPRYDWRLWQHVHQLPNYHYLLYGDYTTIPCEFREVPYQGAPKIKYTLENDWFIIKGHRSRQRENQRQAQSMAIVSSGFFRGANNSFGETRIHDCANGLWGPGNPTNWVTNDINQHITFVVSQVSATPGVL